MVIESRRVVIIADWRQEGGFLVTISGHSSAGFFHRIAQISFLVNGTRAQVPHCLPYKVSLPHLAKAKKYVQVLFEVVREIKEVGA